MNKSISCSAKETELVKEEVARLRSSGLMIQGGYITLDDIFLFSNPTRNYMSQSCETLLPCPNHQKYCTYGVGVWLKPWY